MQQLKEDTQSLSAAQPDVDLPAEIAAQLQQLEQLDDALAELSEQQTEVVTSSESQPGDAQRSEQQIADRLAEEARRQGLPASVDRALRQAGDRAGQAATTMLDRSPSAGSIRRQAAQAAQQALQAARAATSAQLQAVRRQKASRSATVAQRGGSEDAQRPGLEGTSSEPGGESAEAGGQSTPATNSDTNSSEDVALDSPAMASQRMAGEGQRTTGEGTVAAGPAATDAPGSPACRPNCVKRSVPHARSQLPRGYEDRLRRYFQSVDPQRSTQSARQ